MRYSYPSQFDAEELGKRGMKALQWTIVVLFSFGFLALIEPYMTPIGPTCLTCVSGQGWCSIVVLLISIIVLFYFRVD